MHLLLVEDQEDLARGLEIGLEEAGYSVDIAYDGMEGEMRALSTSYDLLLVDWMLPRQDGLTLIQHVRDAGVRCPILMLTALTDVEDRVKGLDAGADDYLTKPFAFDELFARLRALRRRENMQKQRPSMRLRSGPLTIDRRGRKVLWKGEELDVRPKEYELLELLLRRANGVITRTVIAESVWGSTFVTDDTINTTVSSVRRRLRDVDSEAAGIVIETVRGVGYRLTTAEPTTSGASS
ncbi:MAG: response regulator [Bacteroidetes bacterium]|nr:response regulator [Bacteroidota bacterium]